MKMGEIRISKYPNDFNEPQGDSYSTALKDHWFLVAAIPFLTAEGGMS